MKSETTEKFISNPYNEKYLYSINRNAFSKENSANIYTRHYGDNLAKEESLYIIFGTDSGLLAKFIINQELPKNTRYLFIELPHLIEKITSNLPDDYDQESFVFTTPDKWQEAANQLEINIYIYKDKVEYVKSFAVIDSYLIDYHSVNQKIVQDIEILFFFTRALIGVFPFMTKQLTNISENKYSSTQLNDLFKEKTCVILGGGPSLDEDIDWIKANQHNIVIIAVSRIAKTLLKNQITPHIIMSVDPYEVSFDVSKELLTLPKEVLFLHANCVIPSLLSQWHGKSIYIGARFPWTEKTDEKVHIAGGPTVTNTAVKAAVEMGFSNILLSGVDLCYSKSGVSHAANSNEANTGPTLGQPGIWVETYAGHKAETLIAFDHAVLTLGQQATQALEQGVSIYNLSENAAKVENIAHMPTSALSFENEKDNTWQLLQDAVPKMSEQDIRQDNNFVSANVSKMLKGIQAVKLLAEEALECNTQLFKDKGKESENFKYKIRMDKIEKKLDSQYKKATTFIKNFGLDKFIKSAHTSHDDWSDEKVEETGRLYYQAYLDASKELITLLKSTLERIECRIEEHKSSANIDVLLAQWSKDKQYGRALVWQEFSDINTTKLTIEDQKKYDDCLEQFKQVMASKNTAHLARTKQQASLDGVKRKIIILFNQHNVDALHVLATSLRLYDAQSSNYQQAQELYIVAQAFSCVLNQDYHVAFEYFEQLPDTSIAEDELQQMASLAIKLTHYEKAEQALERLATIATIYTPQYAKILHLMGKSAQSIELYEQYLMESPEDIQTWLALGLLYLNLKSDESAKLAFKYILSQEPTNIQAQSYLQQLEK